MGIVDPTVERTSLSRHQRFHLQCRAHPALQRLARRYVVAGSDRNVRYKELKLIAIASLVALFCAYLRGKLRTSLTSCVAPRKQEVT